MSKTLNMLALNGFLIAIGLLTSCNQVFYQPMKELIDTPDRLGLAWAATKISVPSGEKIAIWHLKSTSKPAAVIVHLHGNAENRSTHMSFVAWMAKAGCEVITFDYRGYGDSDGMPSRAATIEDSGAIIKWTRENRDFDGLPIVVVGQSLGGAIAVPTLAWYARQHPKQNPVAGLIIDSAFSSYRRITRIKLSSFWLTWPLQWPLSFLVSDELSPIEDAKYIDIPVLQFHSKNDHVVPYELGRELFLALGTKQKEFIDVDQPSHTGAFAVSNSSYRKKALDFIRTFAH